MSGNAIPTKSRLLVKGRDDGRCERCGANGSEWSHRRGRAVKGGHFQHCPCNGMWMCHTCHKFCHANPAEARRFGWFVPSHEDAPHTVPAKTYGGWVMYDCGGGIAHAATPERGHLDA